jgi:hypothetical protein
MNVVSDELTEPVDMEEIYAHPVPYLLRLVLKKTIFAAWAEPNSVIQ